MADSENVAKLKRITIILALLVIAYFVFIYSIKAYFLLGNDLAISLEPRQLSVKLYQNQTKDVSITLKTNNNIFCKTICQYRIIDQGNPSHIIEGNATISPSISREGVEVNYTLASPAKGKGQTIYNAEFLCENRQTFLCQTDGRTLFETALITLNYEPNPMQQNISELAFAKLNTTIADFSTADVARQKNSIIEHYLATRLMSRDIVNTSSSADELYEEINSTIAQIKYSWDDENYTGIIERIDDIDGRLSNLHSIDLMLASQMDSLVNVHNSMAIKIAFQKEHLKSIIEGWRHNNGISKDGAVAARNIIVAVDTLADSSAVFNSLNFSNYTELKGYYDRAENAIRSAEDMAFAEQHSMIRSGQDAYAAEAEMMCSLKGYCIEPKSYFYSEDIAENIDAKEVICSDIRKLNKSYNEAYSAYMSAYAKSNGTTVDVSSLNASMLNSLIDAEVANSIARSENNIVISQNEKSAAYNAMLATNNFTAAHTDHQACMNMAEYFNAINDSESAEIYKKEEAYNRIRDECNSSMIGSGNITLMPFAMLQVQDYINTTQMYESLGISRQQLLSLIELHHTPYTDSFYNRYCVEQPATYEPTMTQNASADTNLSVSFSQVSRYYDILSSINISRIDLMQPTNITPRVNLTLREHSYTCCAFGSCRVCCDSGSCDNSFAYPVIFVHGHAMNKAQSPIYSMNVFTRLQLDLSSEGYINAGTIVPTSRYSDIDKGEWGRTPYPIAVKYSYYYAIYDANNSIIDVIMNSEHISDYASRLHDAIELVKYRTGQKKVIVIAHSMGGLVSREYIKEYGDDSVAKLVMIATPNNGTRGTTSDYCNILGAGIECSEMQAGSSFLSRLNAYHFQTGGNHTKYYTIVGTGCDTEGADGDGLIRRDDAVLSYAKGYLVNSTCDNMFDPLHNTMLYGNGYNQTYSYVKQIIKG